MRIVYVLTSLGIGGAERQALTLAACMAQRGHSVQIIALRTLPEEWVTTLPLVHLGISKSPWSATAGLLRARRLLRDLQPDLVHSHNFHANIFARLLRVRDSRPALIATVHNVYEGGWLRMMAYRLTDGLSTRTTAVSEAVAHRFIAEKAISRGRSLVVPNAIEARDYTPDSARRAATRAALGAGEDFAWLAAGRIAPAKDYPNLLRAFARVRAAAPHTRLWIAGQSSMRAEEQLRHLAAELGIADRVQWLGLRRDLPALLDGADGFVSSSAWEGMPLAVAEAMAMEKPVVATDAGGVRELVGDAGCVVPVRDAVALAGAMLILMCDSAAMRGARGRAARRRIAARFSMEIRAAEWESIYRAAVAERE